MNKFNKPSGRTARATKKAKSKRSKEAAGIPQGHKLAVKLQGGKRTGKAARKEARTANRAAAAAERTATASQAPIEEAMLDAPKQRKQQGKKDRTSKTADSETPMPMES